MLLPLASMAVGIAEPEATPAMLITPVANTTVIIREVLTGRATFGAFVLAFASSCVYAGLMLSLAARAVQQRAARQPGVGAGLAEGPAPRARAGTRPRRLPPVDAALALFVVCAAAAVLRQPRARARSTALLPIVVVNQLAAHPRADAAVRVRSAAGSWRETFSLAQPGGGVARRRGAARHRPGPGRAARSASSSRRSGRRTRTKAQADAELILPALDGAPGARPARRRRARRGLRGDAVPRPAPDGASCAACRRGRRS